MMEKGVKAGFPDWGGQEVWILGGGPSLSRQFLVPEEIIRQIEQGKLPISILSPYFKPIHNKKVIGVNMSYRLGDWVDMIFWGDKEFMKKPKVVGDINNFGGYIVTSNSVYNHPKIKNEGIYCIPRDNKKKYGLHPKSTHTCWNGNSGANAIDIAVHAGAKRIILVGFDMKSSETHSHFHNLYNKKKNPPYRTHLKGFPQIAKDAKEMGVEIINANPDSAIESFPKCNVSDLIELNPPKMLDINIEKSRGALNKYKTLQEIHKLVNPNCYLEIGVDRGKSLKLSNAPITIGIDANPKITSNKVRKTTSEKFFKNHTFHNPIDLCFIDSNHLIEDVLYDFIQVEKNCTTNSVIIIDDVAPAHPVQANRVRVSIKWAGDVWKLHRILQKFRPDLSLKLLDTSPTGMLVVTHLDPKNKTLENKYNELISKVKTSPVPDAVIERAEAIKDLAKLELFKYKQKISIGEQLIKTGTEKIIIKNDDMQKDYKIGVVTPTCSPERKPFLEFLEKRIYGQTKQVDKWYLVNYPNNSHIPDLAKRYKQGIKKAVEDECDLIFLMEDDDYYPYTYIEELFKEWKKKGCPTIIGVNGTVYFHLKHDGYASFPQNKRTSAFETAITSNAIYDQCPDHVIDYDIKLWKANQPDGVLVDIPHRPVGIKHGLGLTGGRYHTKGKYNTNKPPQMQLKNLVDEEAYNFYQKIKKNL